MQPSWCYRGKKGKNESEVGSCAPSKITEVCSRKKDGQCHWLTCCSLQKKKNDIVPNVTGMATGTERKRELCGAGALGALLG